RSRWILMRDGRLLAVEDRDRATARRESCGRSPMESFTIPASLPQQAGGAPPQWSRRPATWSVLCLELAVEPQSEGGLRRGLGEPVLIAEAPDGGSGGEEFGSVLAPDVIVDLDGYPDDARGPRLRGLRLHPGQRKFPGLVDALGEDHHLLVAARLPQRLQR